MPDDRIRPRSAQELVYAETLEDAHKQFFFEAEYSDLLEGYLRDFIALADRVAGVIGPRSDA